MNASSPRPPSHLSQTIVPTESSWRSKFFREAPSQGRKVAQLAFPDGDHSPTRNFKFLFRSLVPGYVTRELALPEIRTGLGDISQSAVVPVPKAAVDKESDAPSAEDDIRLARKVPGMEPKPVAHRVQEPANGHFRSRVPASDTAHEGAPLGRAHDVGPNIRLASALNRW